jgi:hypothetical protein
MQTVKQWSPTVFDHPIGYFPRMEGMDDWVVLPWIQTRDSGPHARADYDAVVEAMDEACTVRWWFWWQGEQVEGESYQTDDYEEHRFGHWGPGWYDCIVVRPGTKAEMVAREIADAYSDYPCVDESRLSEYEWEEASEYWQSMSIGDRIEAIASGRYGLENTSIFAARRDELPDGIWVSEFIAP